MGLPCGWVTDCEVSEGKSIGRSAALRCLGNGVVPQQAALAWRMLT